MKTRYVTEMGMGTDVHGRNYTQAAERAVFDAIHHSSLQLFAPLGKTPDDMFIDLLIGVPEPDQVDKDKVGNKVALVEMIAPRIIVNLLAPLTIFRFKQQITKGWVDLKPTFHLSNNTLS